MFNKKTYENQPMMGDMYQQYNPNMFDPNQGMIAPNMQIERLIYEIKENRRRISNLAKRISRLENYLRIKDDITNPTEDDFHNPGNFSF